MNGRGKSDSPIVPRKLPNKGRGALRFAEGVEGRGLAEGNLFQQPRFRTQSRTDLQSALRRIRQAALMQGRLFLAPTLPIHPDHSSNSQALRNAL